MALGRKTGGGSRKGIPNKATASVKEAIEFAAREVGGGERLAEWVKESPDNERVFWASIYPKLLPLQVAATGDGTPPVVTFNVQPVRAAHRGEGVD